MIAALYLRSATRNDDAIAEQHRVCTEHAKTRGWSVGEIFVDNGTSGVCDDRPKLGALRDCLREGRVSVVITADAARVFRDLDKLDDFIDFCHAMGSELWYAGATGPAERPMLRPSKEAIAGCRRRAVGRTSA